VARLSDRALYRQEMARQLHIMRGRQTINKANDNNNNNNNNNNKKEKTCILIDVAIPVDRNVVQKEAEKKLKYKGLCTEIQRTWNLKCTIIPVRNGVTGIVT